ncbi:MAG: sugar phosphate isomerase/epimerase [Clostridia bacterium]|nr:sugar phosphate isomerase/epimerase [Clostridia bacterium]
MIISTQTLFLAKQYGLVKSVEMLADAGFDAIDISMDDVSSPIFGEGYREFAEQLLAVARERGVKFIQAHAPFGGGYNNYINNLLPYMPRAFEFCSLVGIRNIVVHPPQPMRYYGNEQKIFDMSIEFYKSLAPVAKQYGVRIAIENMWQRHPINQNIVDDIIADPAELARMYDTLADPETFTVCLDIGHVALCGREPEDAVRTVGGERLGCLHVHDVDYRSDLHTLPGVSKINWQRVCEALAEVDYKGAFNLEADNFYLGFIPEQHAIAAKFMADISRAFANKIEELKAAK